MLFRPRNVPDLDRPLGHLLTPNSIIQSAAKPCVSNREAGSRSLEMLERPALFMKMDHGKSVSR